MIKESILINTNKDDISPKVNTFFRPSELLLLQLSSKKINK